VRRAARCCRIPRLSEMVPSHELWNVVADSIWFGGEAGARLYSQLWLGDLVAVHLPVLESVSADGYQLYPGTPALPGLHHTFSPGLHLVAGVNGLGKTTLLLLLFHGLVGATSVQADNFAAPRLDLIRNKVADRFRKRVADGAVGATLALEFRIAGDSYRVTRDLSNLKLIDWKLNGFTQALSDQTYEDAIMASMNLGTFPDVLLILNMIVFMFEDHPRLMWDQLVQRNVIRALFLSPSQARDLADKAQAVTAANSAYRNLNYIVNRDRNALLKARRAQANANTTSAEYAALLQAMAGDDEKLAVLSQKLLDADERRTEARAALERSRFTYDDSVSEIEALKLARIEQAFPDAGESAHYIVTRLLGDSTCLACGESDGPLIEKWARMIESGSCSLCGTSRPDRRFQFDLHVGRQSELGPVVRQLGVLRLGRRIGCGVCKPLRFRSFLPVLLWCRHVPTVALSRVGIQTQNALAGQSGTSHPHRREQTQNNWLDNPDPFAPFPPRVAGRERDAPRWKAIRKRSTSNAAPAPG